MGGKELGEINNEIGGLAQYLSGRREVILQTWRNAIKKDPALTTSDSLPRADLYDHIPSLLATFERQLHIWRVDEVVSVAAQSSAARRKVPVSSGR